jgi:HK97 family phage portal protein
MSKVQVLKLTSPVRKESAQTHTTKSGTIPRPYSDIYGDLINYYDGTPDMNSWHSRCLELKARCAVGLGMNFEGGDTEEIRKRLDFFNEYGQSFDEVLFRADLDYETTGNGYIEIIRGKGGKIVEAYHAPATTMWRYALQQNYVESQAQQIWGNAKPGQEYHFEYNNGDAPVPYPMYRPGSKDERSIIHFAQPAQGQRYYGLPVWRGAISDIELNYNAVLYNRRWFLNNGVPDAILKVIGAGMKKEEKEAIQTYVQDNFVGIENAAKLLLVTIDDFDAKIELEKLNENRDKDGAFHQLRIDNRDNIVAAHGVPPRLLGIMSAGQLGGTGENHGQLKSFQETTINPIQTMYERKLAPVIEEMGIRYPMTFQEIDTTIEEKDSELVAAGIMTPNEARNKRGLDELPDGDSIEEKEETPEKAIALVKSLNAFRNGV